VKRSFELGKIRRVLILTFPRSDNYDACENRGWAQIASAAARGGAATGANRGYARCPFVNLQIAPASSMKSWESSPTGPADDIMTPGLALDTAEYIGTCKVLTRRPYQAVRRAKRLKDHWPTASGLLPDQALHDVR
jgi:hypothetical protein